jgi:hypothetical protein
MSRHLTWKRLFLSFKIFVSLYLSHQVTLHLLSRVYIKKVLKLNPAVSEQSVLRYCSVGNGVLLPDEPEERSVLFL